MFRQIDLPTVAALVIGAALLGLFLGLTLAGGVQERTMRRIVASGMLTVDGHVYSVTP